LFTPHVAWVDEVLIAIGVGWRMFTVFDTEHPFASVTDSVYEPEHKPVGFGTVMNPGVHIKLYGPVPPVVDALADPLHELPQVTLVVVMAVESWAG
jgi:hypothetical protein